MDPIILDSSSDSSQRTPARGRYSRAVAGRVVESGAIVSFCDGQFTGPADLLWLVRTRFDRPTVDIDLSDLDGHVRRCFETVFGPIVWADMVVAGPVDADVSVVY